MNSHSYTLFCPLLTKQHNYSLEQMNRITLLNFINLDGQIYLQAYDVSLHA